MQICAKCNTQSPDTVKVCPQCQADLSQWSYAAVALQRLKDNPRVLMIRVSVAHNCCPACREAEGAYTKNQVPSLPVEGCSHETGCRCFYQPVLDDIYP